MSDEKAINPLVHRAMHLYWRVSRGVTLGVRGVCMDGCRGVFLVKHTYITGWHLPGGGVEPGESLQAALAKELHEEAGLELTGPPVLHGMFFNSRVSNRDHVAVYIVNDFKVLREVAPNREISAAGFFPLDDLPADTTQATRRRLAEIANGTPPAAEW